MIFLLELPLLLTVLPASTVVWPAWIAAYLTGCFYLEKAVRAAKPRFSLSPKMFLIALPSAVVLGKSYVYRTHVGSILAFLERLSGAPSEQILSVLALVLGCLSAVSLLVLMGLAGPALQRQAARRGMPLSQDAALPGSPDRLDKKEICFCALLALFTAAAFSFLFPLRRWMPGADQPVFLYIGREMTRGRVPYRDMFDHKGLYLYFIQYFGTLFSLPGTYSGVWFLEILDLFAFCLLLHKLAGLVSGSRSVRRLTVFAVAVLSGASLYVGGDMAEEYTLPWVSFALYVFSAYFLSGEYRKRDIFFLGLSCGVVFFIKANVVAVWACLVPVTLAVLIVRKRSREILPCIGLFTLGLAAAFVPVLAYTLATGSLDEMIRYYIVFNMEYSSFGGNLSTILHAILFFLYSLPVGFCALGVSVFYRVNDSRRGRLMHLANLLAFSVSLYLSSISGRAAPHYAVILLPMLALPISNMAQLLREAWAGRADALPAPPSSSVRGKAVKALLVCLFCAFCVGTNIREGASSGPSPIVEYLTTHTAPEDDVLIISFGNSYYLDSGRSSENKFFFQDPPLLISDALYREFLDEFEKKPSDVVLFNDSRQAYLDSTLSNMGDFIRRMEQRREAGEYSFEEFGIFCVYTRVR